MNISIQDTYLLINTYKPENQNILLTKNFTIMKKFLILVLCLLSFFGIKAQTAVSLSQAVKAVEAQFTGQDVDYFQIIENNATHWKIFVDADPLKGWQHKCFVYSVPLTVTTSTTNIPLERKMFTLPPKGNYRPLKVKNRYANVMFKPAVSKETLSNNTLEAAKKTYAVIISGGVSKISNYERYWNDCSFIYQALVNKYGVPNDNIYCHV